MGLTLDFAPAVFHLLEGAFRACTSVRTMVKIKGACKTSQEVQTYLVNRHVDWDREAKEPSEDKRLDLEEQRIAVVREQVEALRGLGFPAIQIHEALSKYIFGPLDRLERRTSVEILSHD
jgi:Holliday junction resolvasome RuvABC DNA-binding subunit